MRYIDADSLYRRVKTHTKPTLDYQSGVKVLDMINQEPTADVAPKSEVDRAYERGFERGKKDNVCGFSAEEIAQKGEEIAIELEAMRMAANSYKMHYESLAREIFEEIEELAKIYTFPVVKNGVVEIAKEPFWCIEPNDLAELKKKYTEDSDES